MTEHWMDKVPDGLFCNVFARLSLEDSYPLVLTCKRFSWFAPVWIPMILMETSDKDRFMKCAEDMTQESIIKILPRMLRYYKLSLQQLSKWVMWSSQMGYPDLLEFVLERFEKRGLDPTRNSVMYASKWAAHNGHINILRILYQNNDPNGQDSNDVVEEKELVENKKKLRNPLSFKIPIQVCVLPSVELACQNNQLASIQFLCQYDAAVIYKDSTALERCCEKGFSDLVIYLLDDGRFIPRRETLERAIVSKHPKVVESLLLDGRSQKFCKDFFILSCQCANAEIVSMVLDVLNDTKCDLSTIGPDGFSAACRNEKIDVVQMLLDKPFVSIEGIQMEVSFCCEKGLPNTLKILLSSSSTDALFGNVRLLMDTVVSNRHASFVALLNHPACKPSVSNNRVLMTCCELGRYDFVVSLVEDPKVENINYKQAIDIAKHNNHKDIITFLNTKKPAPEGFLKRLFG